MKIVVTPAYLGQLITRLRTTATGLGVQRNRLARISYPSMPAETTRSVRESVERARTSLTRVSGECGSMAAQLTKRKDFQPPEAYPSLAPTAALTREAERRADRLAKRISEGKANIKDDIKFVHDVELQFQLALRLGDSGFRKYLKQLDERFKFARELIAEREWKKRRDEEVAGAIASREKFFSKHHLGWAYPKGLSTGFFNATTAFEATAYSIEGAIHDQAPWSPERKEMWKDLDMPTNTEAIGQSLEFAYRNPGEFGKALVAWDKFADGRIGEGLGEVSFSALLMGITGGTGSASTAMRFSSAARRSQMVSASAARNAALAADSAQATAAALRAAALESRVSSTAPGGLGRNVNFRQTRATRVEAAAAAARAETYAGHAAQARLAAAAARETKWRQAGLATASLVTSWVGLDVTRLRSTLNWLQGGVSSLNTAMWLERPGDPQPPGRP